MNTNDGGPRHDSEVLSRTFLNARTYNALTTAGYVTVGDVRAATDVDLLGLRSLSKGSLNHIRRACPFDPLARVHEEFKTGRPRSCEIPHDLRDWFAGQALSGMDVYTFTARRMDGRSPLDDSKTLQTSIETATKFAYLVADAMLAARNGGAA